MTRKNNPLLVDETLDRTSAMTAYDSVLVAALVSGQSTAGRCKKKNSLPVGPFGPMTFFVINWISIDRLIDLDSY